MSDAIKRARDLLNDPDLPRHNYSVAKIREGFIVLDAQHKAALAVVEAANGVVELEGGKDLIPLDVDGEPMGSWQLLVQALTAYDTLKAEEAG